jgi:hypothetical protein
MGEDAPQLPFAIPAGIGSIGWIPDLRRDPLGPQGSAESSQLHNNFHRNWSSPAGATTTRPRLVEPVVSLFLRPTFGSCESAILSQNPLSIWRMSVE